MKNLLGILAIMSTFVMTSFSQNVINMTEFNLTVDGVPSNDFIVTINQLDEYSPGTLLILFGGVMDLVDFQGNGVIDVVGMSDYYEYPSKGVGIKMLKVDFFDMLPGVINIVTTSGNYNIINYTEQDTVNSFNNGVNSVNTQSFYDMGVASVDTMMYYNMGKESVPNPTVDPDEIFQEGVEHGIASVDTMKYYDMGVRSIDTESFYNSGVASVNKDSIYQSGVSSVVIPKCDTEEAFYEGQMSVDTDSVGVFYDIGFADGMSLASTQTTATTKSAFDFNVDVYPNPANSGDYINVNCFDYSHVDIYTVTGQTVRKGDTDTYISTDGFENGVYILNVWNVHNKYKIVKIIVQ